MSDTRRVNQSRRSLAEQMRDMNINSTAGARKTRASGGYERSAVPGMAQEEEEPYQYERSTVPGARSTGSLPKPTGRVASRQQRLAREQEMEEEPYQRSAVRKGMPQPTGRVQRMARRVNETGSFGDDGVHHSTQHTFDGIAGEPLLTEEGLPWGGKIHEAGRMTSEWLGSMHHSDVDGMDAETDAQHGALMQKFHEAAGLYHTNGMTDELKELHANGKVPLLSANGNEFVHVDEDHYHQLMSAKHQTGNMMHFLQAQYI